MFIFCINFPIQIFSNARTLDFQPFHFHPNHSSFSFSLLLLTRTSFFSLTKKKKKEEGKKKLHVANSPTTIYTTSHSIRSMCNACVCKKKKLFFVSILPLRNDYPHSSSSPSLRSNFSYDHFPTFTLNDPSTMTLLPTSLSPFFPQWAFPTFAKASLSISLSLSLSVCSFYHY